MKNLYNSMGQLIAAIRMCLKNEQHLPALILIYSGIDIAGWFDSDNPNAKIKDTFISWVDRYVLVSEQLECTSTDLYSARCGLLHRLNPDSRISETGSARLIAYTCGTKTNIFKDAISDYNKTSEYVSIHIDDLFDAYLLGLEAFFNEVKKDHTRKAKISKKAKRYYEPPIDASRVSEISFT